MKLLRLQKTATFIIISLISQLVFSQNKPLTTTPFLIDNQSISVDDYNKRMVVTKKLEDGNMVKNEIRGSGISIGTGNTIGKAILLGAIFGFIIGRIIGLFNGHSSNSTTPLLNRIVAFSTQMNIKREMAYQNKLDLYLKYR